MLLATVAATITAASGVVSSKAIVLMLSISCLSALEIVSGECVIETKIK